MVLAKVVAIGLAIFQFLILLDGGLVRDVLADRQGVEAAVLDMDTEGADVDDIVEVLGRKDRLLGTLQAHEVTVAPALVESAWRLAE